MNKNNKIELHELFKSFNPYPDINNNEIIEIEKKEIRTKINNVMNDMSIQDLNSIINIIKKLGFNMSKKENKKWQK